MISFLLAMTLGALSAHASDWQTQLDEAVAQAPAELVAHAATAPTVPTRNGGLRLVDLGADYGPLLAADRLINGDDPAEVRVAIATAITPRIHGWPEIAVGLVDSEADPAVRAALLAGLRKLDPQLAMPRLTQALDDQDPAVRIEAAAVLGRHADGALAGNALATALGDDLPEVRALAARALGRHAVSDAFGPLSERLVDSDATVRLRALRALAAIDADATAALPQLDGLLADPDSKVARAAAQLR